MSDQRKNPTPDSALRRFRSGGRVWNTGGWEERDGGAAVRWWTGHEVDAAGVEHATVMEYRVEGRIRADGLEFQRALVLTPQHVYQAVEGRVAFENFVLFEIRSTIDQKRGEAAAKRIVELVAELNDKIRILREVHGVVTLEITCPDDPMLWAPTVNNPEFTIGRLYPKPENWSPR